MKVHLEVRHVAKPSVVAARPKPKPVAPPTKFELRNAGRAVDGHAKLAESYEQRVAALTATAAKLEADAVQATSLDDPAEHSQAAALASSLKADAVAHRTEAEGHAAMAKTHRDAAAKYAKVLAKAPTRAA